MAFDTKSLNILYEALDLQEEGFRDLSGLEIDFDMNGLRTVILNVKEKL